MRYNEDTKRFLVTVEERVSCGLFPRAPAPFVKLMLSPALNGKKHLDCKMPSCNSPGWQGGQEHQDGKSLQGWINSQTATVMKQELFWRCTGCEIIMCLQELGVSSSGI